MNDQTLTQTDRVIASAEAASRRWDAIAADFDKALQNLLRVCPQALDTDPALGWVQVAGPKQAR